MSKASLITLLSDFGLNDIYVAVMKGAIAQINPQVQIVDLTHNIRPQNIAAASFNLMSAYPYFPQGTVHVAVVDPGVGSDRRSVAIQIEQGFLVGPDNGIFTGVLGQVEAIAAVELTNPKYWRVPQPSYTFHGRDIFATVGAYLASGVPLQALGTPIQPQTLVRLPLPACARTKQGLKGCVQYIDKFGNLISNIPSQLVQDRDWLLLTGDYIIPHAKTYSSSDRGALVAVVGSEGWIEVAVNGGNAHQELKINLGTTLEVRFV